MKYVLWWIIPIWLSSQELSYSTFIQNVTAFHPAFLQSELIPKSGDATVLAARGNFDPKLASDLSQKEFADKLYYRIWESDLTVPVIGPLDLYSGYSQSRGLFLNPENENSPDGLLQVGAKLDVLQGFFNNKRSIELKRAKNFQLLTQIQQRQALNKLIFDASKAYTNWAKDFALLQFQKNFVKVTKDRFENVKQNYQLGEIAAIDTLEAFIQYQNRLADFNDTFVNYYRSTLEVSSFIWNQNEPILLNENQFPENLDKLQLDVLNNENWIDNHPEILVTENKIEDLQLERRMKQQGLLPKLSLKYNFLNESFGYNFTQEFNTQNYNFGMEFSVPLFIRRERGELQLTKLKIQDAELGLKDKRNILFNKVSAIENEQKILDQQVELFKQIQQHTQTLFEAEKTKFSIGESSLFLIIAREINFLNAAQKLIQTQSKRLESILKLNFEKGGPF